MVQAWERTRTFFHSNSEYKSYQAIVLLFKATLPNCGTFSAIKLFARVHPQVVYDDYLDSIRESGLRRTRIGIITITLWFITTRLACLVIAVCAFAIKATVVVMQLVAPGTGLV